MKQARDDKFNYTRQGSDDMDQVRKIVSDAWQKGIDLGYTPHEIFYEITSEANVEFLMVALNFKGNKS